MLTTYKCRAKKLMDDVKQSQGTEEVKPEVQEKLAEMKQESQTRAERAKTVSERLEKLTQSAAVQPEPMPSSNQTTEEAKPQSETQSQNVEQPTLPDSASDRTKEQFQKLLEENRKLKEEHRKAAGNSVFDALRPKEVPGVDMSQFGQINPQTATQLTQDFIGPDGVDVDGLNKALKAANDRATLAEIEASHAAQRIQQFDERQQVQEAHAAFPELDPQNSERFDPNFYDLVALKIAKSGMRLTLSQAAQQVRQTYSPAAAPNVAKAQEEAVSQYKQSLVNKNQQQPFSTGQGEPRVVETSQELRERTRKGDAYALDERLRKLGLIS